MKKRVWSTGRKGGEPVQLRLALDAPVAQLDFDSANSCPNCQAILTKIRACWHCLRCGYTSCSLD